MKNNVNLDKALAAIRQWPGARTDRKVFTVIADYANGKGVSTVRQTTIAAAIDMDRYDVALSVHRLDDRGFISIKKNLEDGYFRNAYTIAPDYMNGTPNGAADMAATVAELSQHLDIVAIGVLAAEKAVYAQAPKIDANTERIEELEKRIAGLENAIKANGNK